MVKQRPGFATSRALNWTQVFLRGQVKLRQISEFQDFPGAIVWGQYQITSRNGADENQDRVFYSFFCMFISNWIVNNLPKTQSIESMDFTLFYP